MSSNWFSAALPELESGRELPVAVVQEAIRVLTQPDFDHGQAEAFLRRLAERGETVSEIVAAVQVLREQMVPLPCSFSPILDTCGTGGDHSGTFNISTAVSLVLAGAGVKVVKHGNRSASSKSGSADLLASLGVPIEGGVDWAAQTLADVGYAFCFAPLFHPTLKYVAPLRREMGIRTIFNLLGPLLNPTKASHQLLGVARAELLPVLSQAVQKLGQTTAFLVRSHDGLDEVSLAAPTEVISIRNGRSETFTWTPDDFGLAATPLESIQVNSPAESAAFVQSILQGVPGPGRRVVVANAAAGLLLIERVKSLREGVEIAEHSLDSGESLRVLQRLQRAKR